MPYKMWVHTCSKEKRAKVWWVVEVCPNCGKRGLYDGWYYSTFEKMAAYRRSTGILPFGPHRVFADRLLGPRTKPCKRCKGRGLVNIENGSDWSTCPRCQGAGYVFKGNQETFESLRTRIMEAYPGIWNTNTRAFEQETALSDQTGVSLIAPNGKHPTAGKAIKAKKVRSASKKQTSIKSRISKPITRPIRKRAGM